MLKGTLTFWIALSTICVCAQTNAPAVREPVPTERQLRWHETEFFALIHFGLNTYSDREWGYGEDDPTLFNPQHLDVNQVMETLKAGGMRGVILVAKHHDGFCLWPTKTTDYNISKSPWRGGKGDLVRDYADAAKKHGLRFGIYCSPWDRNSALYGKPEYLSVYHGQLRELLTGYGTLFEVWFDGANGGDGYYGGAREKRSIDRLTYYDWPKTWGMVRELQPTACIFGDVGPDCRWVGNESGYAAENCWATFTPKGRTDAARAANGDSMNAVEGPSGHRDGTLWIPAECDVPLRKGWFWHPNEDETVRQPAKLLDIYFNSVGKGGCLNLGVAPNRDGQIAPNDATTIRAFGNFLRALFADNLANNAVAESSQTRGDGRTAAFAPTNLLDEDSATYWATDDDVTAATVTLTLPAVSEFNVIRLREAIALGQRVHRYVLDVWQDGAWQEYATGESIGACRLIRGPKVKSDRLRLRITEAAAAPCLTEFGLYLMPALLAE